MNHPLLETILSKKPATRNRPVEELLGGLSRPELLKTLLVLEQFRQNTDNLYHQVRACLFSFAACRFYLLDPQDHTFPGKIAARTAEKLRTGNYSEALRLLHRQLSGRPSPACLSALAHAAYREAFTLLLSQVKDSIQTSAGNGWLFSISSLENYPLRATAAYLEKAPETGRYPLGAEFSPVRVDPCHSGWSDIFLVAMDFPQGARVVNLSVDIAPKNRNRPRPPVECYLRVIEERVLRLTSLDLRCQRDIRHLHSLFDFTADHLSLLKAGVIAAGIVPPSFEGTSIPLGKIMDLLVGDGRGLEIITRVRHLPPGSRMAVSTALLNAIITSLMRLTGQIRNPEGELTDQDRELVAGRTILGEWLGGSGGGWQDSGGLWPGLKKMEGVTAAPGDREFGSSRGRLLPRVKTIPVSTLPPNIENSWRQSLVLFHSGQARNVGPILEMVTEKYLLRYRDEWAARCRELGFYRRILDALQRGDMRELGQTVSLDWEEGTKRIIPAASDPFTEDLIEVMKERWGKQYLGFLMLGGAAGGGMAFIVDPGVHQDFSRDLLTQMRHLRRVHDRALPFAMNPVVFDFTLNKTGIRAELRQGRKAIPPGPTRNQGSFSRHQEGKIKDFGQRHGYSPTRQRQLREQYRQGLIGLGENRLPLNTRIEDIRERDLLTPGPTGEISGRARRERGESSIARGEAAVITLAGGMGSRWSGGTRGVKALAPLAVLQGKFRSFLEIHLSKSELLRRQTGTAAPHIFTTSFLTDGPIARTLRKRKNFGYAGTVMLSPSPWLARRIIPTIGDLRIIWEKKLSNIADPAARRHGEDLLKAREQAIRARGEARNYSANNLMALFHPPGHWYEFPGMIRNGTLRRLLRKHPSIRYLLLHNLDSIATTLDPELLGLHIEGGAVCTFEVTPKWWGDRGGYLARVNDKVRLVEAMALPRDNDHLRLSYYNSLTCWISLDPFLEFLGLDRKDILMSGHGQTREKKIAAALKKVETRMPTYAALKEVRENWGQGQGDSFPVIQAEKLWGDLTSLKELNCSFIPVSRRRAQQLKNPEGLDHWIREGSLQYLEALCHFST